MMEPWPRVPRASDSGGCRRVSSDRPTCVIVSAQPDAPTERCGDQCHDGVLGLTRCLTSACVAVIISATGCPEAHAWSAPCMDSPAPYRESRERRGGGRRACAVMPRAHAQHACCARARVCEGVYALRASTGPAQQASHCNRPHLPRHCRLRIGMISRRMVR